VRTATSPSPRTSARLAALGWIASAAILALSFAVSPNYDWYPDRTSPYAGDFLHEYVGGWVVRAGDPARLYEISYFEAAQHDPALTGFTWPTEHFFQALHPPFYYLWVAPLSLLDYRTAAHLWAALGVAALVASAALLIGSDDRLRPWLGWAVALCVFYTPVAETLVSGQKSTLLLLLFTGTYLLLTRRWLFLAGATFGCVALKPQLLLVVALVMLAKREWRFLAGMAAAGALLGAQSLLVGWKACTGWLAAIADPYPQLKLVGRSHSWFGFVQLITGDDSGPLVLALTAALILATGVALVCLLRGRLAFESPRFGVQFSAMVLATPLVSPYLYKTYDMAITVLPLVVLACEMPTNTAARRLWLVALALVFAMGGLSPVIAERIPLQCSALATFALLWVLVAVPPRDAAPAGSDRTRSEGPHPEAPPARDRAS
jgi:hypothetical protein